MFSIIGKACLYYKYFYRAMYGCLHYFCGESEGLALLNRSNHTGRVMAVAPADHPRAVRNRCVVEVFWWRFYIATMLWWIFLWGVWAFVIGLGRISSFFSCNCVELLHFFCYHLLMHSLGVAFQSFTICYFI